ncbi:hypothetical protein K505DRAFT_39100 [Melanomma pulvis-pyrius CBS 109.77]|uniref:Uncharacterized protein n=1 Tax=Melanomma pulvis-pyrius CBS 109.77 TaxID=1314802 RepID=A0A6A6XA95_9PLEO|nr:hypothetical protein K505DRAFT_39100 [Melanomma pulvis-pyrius CBS 109.77]
MPLMLITLKRTYPFVMRTLKSTQAFCFIVTLLCRLLVDIRGRHSKVRETQSKLYLCKKLLSQLNTRRKTEMFKTDFTLRSNENLASI